MLLNITQNASKMTYSDEEHAVSKAAVVFSLIVVVWTLLTNGTIVMGFVINRSKTWPSFSKQILCLSVTDMFVGLTSFPLALLPLLNKPPNYETCSVFFFLFFGSQCASLYQIFGICVHRFISINKASSLNVQRSDNRFLFALVSSSWALSIIVNSLLHLLYGSPNVELKQCQYNEIFHGKTTTASLFLFIAYFAPCILTNIMYTVICLRIRCIVRKVVPGQISVTETSFNQSPSRISRSLTRQNEKAATTDNHASIKIQQNVIRTVGALMAVFNICTIPLIVVLRLDKQHKISRDIKFIVSTLFVLNSAINPIVYSVRTHLLRTSLKKMFQGSFKTLIPCQR